MVHLLRKRLSWRAVEGREGAIPDEAAAWMDLMGFHPAALFARPRKHGWT